MILPDEMVVSSFLQTIALPDRSPQVCDGNGAQARTIVRGEQWWMPGTEPAFQEARSRHDHIIAVAPGSHP